MSASSVGRALHELAEEIGADLIVLGSSRRGLLGRVLLGDDTRAALNGASASIAVAPTAYQDHAQASRRSGSDTTDRLKANTRWSWRGNLQPSSTRRLRH